MASHGAAVEGADARQGRLPSRAGQPGPDDLAVGRRAELVEARIKPGTGFGVLGVGLVEQGRLYRHPVSNPGARARTQGDPAAIPTCAAPQTEVAAHGNIAGVDPGIGCGVRHAGSPPGPLPAPPQAAAAS